MSESGWFDFFATFLEVLRLFDHSRIEIRVLGDKWLKTELDLILLFENFSDGAWALIIQQWSSLPASARYYIIAGKMVHNYLSSQTV